MPDTEADGQHAAPRSTDRDDESSSTRTGRRSVLKLVGAATVTAGIGTASGFGSLEDQGEWRLEKVGHSLLSDPPGEYAEGQIRADGRYGVVGTYLGGGGSFFVDLEDPERPTELHSIPGENEATRNADVKFDPRHEVYYRTRESHEYGPSIGPEGVHVVDYGYGDGTPEDPEILTHLPAGDTHNLFPHPDEPLLYTVNGTVRTPGFDVWDVSDPGSPTKLREAGLPGYCHDVVVDPDRDLLHAAYMSGEFEGYSVHDLSQPRQPELLGSFDYGEHTSYSETDEVGEEGFGSGHYANYDPRRDLVIVGDEKGSGVPGGKHVFDVGWGEGSLQNPVPIAFFVSPNAERQVDPDEQFDWTGHNFTVLPKGDRTLLLSSDYRDGLVVYDITDPTAPEPIDQYLTDDGAADSSETVFPAGDPPMAFGVQYNQARDLIFVSDMVTGVYTFRLTQAG